MVFVFLFLTSLSMRISSFIHIAANGIILSWFGGMGFFVLFFGVFWILFFVLFLFLFFVFCFFAF